MHVTYRVPLIVILSLIVSLAPIGLAASAPAGQPSSVSLGPRHDPSAPHGGRDQHDPVIILRVRALVPEKVKLNDPVQGTVRATVLTMDEEISQIKVQTEEGQRLMLYLDRESLARLYVGAPCLLHVAQRSTQESSRPSEHAESLW
jgi:hypothetical protein